MSYVSRAEQSRRASLRVQIVRLVTDNPGIDSPTIAALVGLPRRRCGSLLGWMERSGLIRIDRPSKHAEACFVHPAPPNLNPPLQKQGPSGQISQGASGQISQGPNVTLTAADLDWMAYYRAQAAARRGRRMECRA